MQLHELISATRELLKDNEAPYLWSDEALVRWLNEGVEDFMRVVGISPRLQTISKSLTAGATDVSLPDAVEVMSSSWAGEFFRDRELFVFNDPIPVDMSVEFALRFRPKRMVNAGDSPEYIPNTYHFTLPYYAAWRALQTDEVEGRNDTLMQYMMQQWRSYTSRYRIELNEGKLSPAGVAKVNPLFT